MRREASGARLLLIGTYRDVELNRRHLLAKTLGELIRERLFERVVLRGLTRGDVSRFIEVATGLTPPAGADLGRADAGAAEEAQVLDRADPGGRAEVIGRRLDRLSERCNEILTIASVIGGEFELGQFGRLIDDLSEDRLLDVLEEALSARVIEELPAAMGRYQFTHALIQETLSEELSLNKRRT